MVEGNRKYESSSIRRLRLLPVHIQAFRTPPRHSQNRSHQPGAADFIFTLRLRSAVPVRQAVVRLKQLEYEYREPMDRKIGWRLKRKSSDYGLPHGTAERSRSVKIKSAGTWLVTSVFDCAAAASETPEYERQQSESPYRT